MRRWLLKTFVLVGLLATVSYLPFSAPQHAKALALIGVPRFSLTGMALFGGKIQQVMVCTCPIFAYLYIKVGNPVPAELVLTYASLQYLNYSYINNSWALGDALPIKIGCYQLEGEDCVEQQEGYPIYHIGTSPPVGRAGGGSDIQAP